MNAPAPAAEPATLPPDELAVLDWIRIRLADLHARHGVEALNIRAIRNPHSGEIDVRWALHSGGQCVIDQRSIAEGVRALREKLEARP